MKKKVTFTDKIKNFFQGEDNSKEKNDENNIPKEVIDKLPPGVKIKKIEIGPKQILKGVLYLILILWTLSILRTILLPQEIEKVPLSNVIETIKKGGAEEVTVMDNEILVKLKDSDKILVSSKEPATSLVETIQREGIDVSTFKFNVENRSGWKAVLEILGTLLSIGLPILFIVWFFGRQTGGGAGGIFGFGKSTAKLFVKGKQNMSFKDIAGVTEAKKDLEEVVDFLKHPDKYRKMGARAPKGVLGWNKGKS